MCVWELYFFEVLSCVCACGCHREIELPLHDDGMEPVEFLKSMGISLTPMNEAALGEARGLKVGLARTSVGLHCRHGEGW